jgi:putative PIN family toxin of toxin-antitoxin system
VFRVVADTNVYISALNFGGAADEVLALGRRNELAVYISAPILKEIDAVLVGKFNWSVANAREACAAIRAFTYLVRPQERLDVVEEDEPDNRILECAVEANARVIVTGDAHLRKLKQFRGIVVLGPAEFLESRLWVERA